MLGFFILGFPQGFLSFLPLYVWLSWNFIQTSISVSYTSSQTMVTPKDCTLESSLKPTLTRYRQIMKVKGQIVKNKDFLPIRLLLRCPKALSCPSSSPQQILPHRSPYHCPLLGPPASSWSVSSPQMILASSPWKIRPRRSPCCSPLRGSPALSWK